MTDHQRAELDVAALAGERAVRMSESLPAHAARWPQRVIAKNSRVVAIGFRRDGVDAPCRHEKPASPIRFDHRSRPVEPGLRTGNDRHLLPPGGGRSA